MWIYCEETCCFNLVFFFSLLDWTENQKVPVRFGSWCCHVSRQHVYLHFKVPEELGESAWEIRWLLSARHTDIQNTEDPVTQSLGQSRRDWGHTNWFWYRWTKLGKYASMWCVCLPKQIQYVNDSEQSTEYCLYSVCFLACWFLICTDFGNVSFGGDENQVLCHRDLFDISFSRAVKHYRLSGAVH